MTNTPSIPAHAATLIRKYREERGLSQRALAAKLGSDVHFTTVSKLETGKMALTLDWAARLAGALDVHFFNILREEGWPEIPTVTVKQVLPGVEWENVPTLAINLAFPANEKSYYIPQRYLKHAPSERLPRFNLGESGKMVRVENEYPSMVDGNHYIFYYDREYYLGIYRDAPPRLVQPRDWPVRYDIRFGPQNVRVIGWAVERLERLYDDGPDAEIV